jgi:hypothetical protein
MSALEFLKDALQGTQLDNLEKYVNQLIDAGSECSDNDDTSTIPNKYRELNAAIENVKNNTVQIDQDIERLLLKKMNHLLSILKAIIEKNKVIEEKLKDIPEPIIAAPRPSPAYTSTPVTSRDLLNPFSSPLLRKFKDEVKRVHKNVSAIKKEFQRKKTLESMPVVVDDHVPNRQVPSLLQPRDGQANYYSSHPENNSSAAPLLSQNNQTTFNKNDKSNGNRKLAIGTSLFLTGAGTGTAVGLAASGKIAIPALTGLVAKMMLLVPAAIAASPVLLGITAGVVTAAIVGLVGLIMYGAYKAYSEFCKSDDSEQRLANPGTVSDADQTRKPILRGNLIMCNKTMKDGEFVRRGHGYNY